MSNSAIPRGARWLAATLLITACGESSVQVLPEQVGRPDLVSAALVPISGDAQEGVVGETLPSPLVVAVVDSLGNAISGAPVVWMARGDTASVTTLTNQEGLTSIHWQLGPVAGEQQLDVAIGGVEGWVAASAPLAAPKEDSGSSTRIKARARPAKPHRILTSHSSLALNVGETVVVTATVVDRFGNVIPDIVVEWRSSDPSIVTVDAVAPAGVRLAE